MADLSKLAVLIDADNTQPAIAEPLLAEISKYGVASVKRIYGDWTLPNLKGWKEILTKHAIQPMQQFANTQGKNSTDSAMIIDAMDLLYSQKLQGFCLVSSDSDFTRLASRIREAGLTVYGFGERKTPQALVSACDKFIYLDVLREPVADTARASTPPKAAASLRQDGKLIGLLSGAIEAASDDEGWAGLGAVGSLIIKQAPDFDARNYGFKKLSELVAALKPVFEVQERGGEGRQKSLYLRKRTGRAASG